MKTQTPSHATYHLGLLIKPLLVYFYCTIISFFKIDMHSFVFELAKITNIICLGNTISEYEFFSLISFKLLPKYTYGRL